MKNKTWLITGASSGLGLELTRFLLANNKNVIALSRTPEKIIQELESNSQLLTASINLNSVPEITKIVEQGIQQFGSLDIIVNNAGYGQFGPFESFSELEIQNEFQVNIFFTYNVVKASLPFLRKQGWGHIFNTSSIAGFAASGYPYITLYTSVKFALDGFSEALNNEIQQFGLGASSILPGWFRTNFLAKRSVRWTEDNLPSDYEQSYKAYQAQLSTADQVQPGSPKKYAQFIHTLSEQNKIPVHIFVGEDAIQIAKEKIHELEKEIASYEALSSATNYEATHDLEQISNENVKLD